MNLFLNNHQNKYKPENIIRLFFPDIKLLQSRKRDRLEEDFFYFRQSSTRLFAVIHQDGKNEVALKKSRDIEKFLYEFLCDSTGRVQPWGMLNGVRPLWLYRQRAAAGMTHPEISQQLHEDFDVSDQKIDLLRRCYETQLTMPIERNVEKYYSLYVSIPYCPSRCRYCSFISMSSNDNDEIELYLKLLLEELSEISESVDQKLLSIYVGGGTPSVLSSSQLERLLSHLNSRFKPLQEFTLEAGRPDSTDLSKLRIMKEQGVDRISINPQTFCDNTLRAIGRHHSADDILRCFEEARKVGHNNINMDLIAGLPTDTVNGFQRSLNETLRLAPENITVHSFTKKSGSHLSQGDFAAHDGLTEMMRLRDELLYQNGYNPYYIYRQKKTPSNLENVGYAKSGYECLYNVYMMDEMHNVISAGAGGVTKYVTGARDSIKRVFHPKYPKEYINLRQQP